MSQILELYGVSTQANYPASVWQTTLKNEQCPFLVSQKCTKKRKSTPDISLGTCSLLYGSQQQPMVICPNRFLQNQQIFLDCLHLLTLHEPGNQLHILPEVNLPGGSVDYFLVSVKSGRVQDFVGIELQAVDTTGTAWDIRQEWLAQHQLASIPHELKSIGINWKMSAKTTLVQLNHKIQTFEYLNKHLVLVLQDALLHYLRQEFQFSHIQTTHSADAMQFHSYSLLPQANNLYQLQLAERISTNAEGIKRSLGLQANPNLELQHILSNLEAKLSSSTLLALY